ncbi:ferritin [Myxococcota bacterium]|nr:ferritin [Myxococcota bacterium]MBU1410398.1 ferritin [Myxococcota bacterium]MBU1511829.1 ferritin [Myxococcota bacterium]
MSKLFEAINDQINAEMFSAYLYQSMAADMEHKGFAGIAHWFLAQAQEEMVHAMKFYGYIIERGEKVTLKALEAPQTTWKDPKAVFEAALTHEKYITSRINNLYKLAQKAGDPATEIMLHWFIKEQVEEEANANEILAKIQLMGKTPDAMYLLDRELAARPMLFTMPVTAA